MYALIKCTSEVFGIKSAMQDWGFQSQAVIKSDASAALGIVQRQGLGKVRHIDCSYLYIQQVCAERLLAFSKVPGAKNTADICTKGLPWEKIAEFVANVGGRFAKGRSDIASKLQSCVANPAVLAAGLEGGCVKSCALSPYCCEYVVCQ